MSQSYGNSDLIRNNASDNYYSSSVLSGNLRNKFKQVINSGTISGSHIMAPTKADMIETVRPEFVADDWKFTEQDNDNLELVSKECLPFGSFESSACDRAVHDELLTMIHKKLQDAQDKMQRKFMFPRNTLQRLATEVQMMAESEPYGLRGAVLYFNLQRDSNGNVEELGQVHCNAHVASTFELNITLFEDVKRWCSILDLVVQGLFSNSKSELYLSPGYKINKRKLHRSNSAGSC